MAFSNSKSSLLSLYPSFSGTKIVILFLFLVTESSSAENSNLFREYIGANFKDVKFSDVPINPKTQFDFILSFAIDYTTTSDPTPTNGKFNIFWDSTNLSPQDVNSIKSQHSNVRVALSLGGATVSSKPVYFNLTTVNSWVSNAFISLKSIIQEYNLDGIDIDYEQFQADPNTFAECIGQLIMKLKANGLIKFVSIAPYDNSEVQNHYQELWKRYGDVIDYVNFQFYAYDKDTSVDQFVKYYEEQKRNYQGGKILTSFLTDGNGGLGPQNGFFDAAKKLKSSDELNGIFVWCADNSKALDFKYEKRSQVLLASST